MIPFKVKVCGLTRPQDAALASELGADMIGLIFYRRSPRFVSLRRAARVRRVLPPTVRATGVFVNDEVERIADRARGLKLDMVQLHGNYGIQEIGFLRRSGLLVVQAYAIGSPADWKAAAASRADLVLVDNVAGDRYGGTGRRFDWRLKPTAKLPNLVLAGGLRADNLAEGVRRFRPLVVDVSSGVESSPGVKSARRMREFFRECDRLRYGS